MNIERLKEIFEDGSSEWEGDNALQGLLILSKYIDYKKKDILQGATHDVIYGPKVDKVLEAGLTEEDAIALRKLNWMIEGDDYFACFV